jgi:IclR family transcriptional regulator, pca regulon regulatory protein
VRTIISPLPYSYRAHHGEELVYIERIRTSQIININLHVGSRLPLYSTSLGRALICDMPEEWLKDYIYRLRDDPNAKNYIKNDKHSLLCRLEEARKLGYAINDEELVKGLRAVGAPIRGRTSEIVAAVGVAVPSSRISVSELRRKFAPELLSIAEKISIALGYRNHK